MRSARLAAAQTNRAEQTLAALSGIGGNSHCLQRVEKLLALADEQPAGGEACDRSLGTADTIGHRTNHRNAGKVGPEFERNGKDQAGLN